MISGFWLYGIVLVNRILLFVSAFICSYYPCADVVDILDQNVVSACDLIWSSTLCATIPIWMLHEIHQDIETCFIGNIMILYCVGHP